MKYLIFSLLIIISTSCKKDYNSRYTATLVNKTSHSLRIMFFNSGVVNPKDTIRLTANQSFEIANGSERGAITTPGFSSNYYGDSIWVVFDGIYRISHYSVTPNQLYPKNYPYTSLRNLINRNSYSFVSTAISTNSYLNEHFYEFIEQDYLDAKN
jgi:hypothetical protein